MRRISLFAVFFGGVVAGFALAADPKLYDLDGREVVVRVYKDEQARREGLYGTIKPLVKGRTIEPEPKDANESAILELFAQDQTDEVLRQYLTGENIGWRYEDGPTFYLPMLRAELDGREILLRIYKDRQQDVSAYREMKLKISGRKVICDIGKLDYPALVTVFGHDQKDPVIRKLLGTSFSAWEYTEGLELYAPLKSQCTQESYRWGLYDAIGNPLPAATVEWYVKSKIAKILLGRYVTDAQGQLSLPFCTGGLRNYQGANRCRCEVRVSAAGYNTSILEPWASAKAGSLFVPRVPAGTEADQRSISGVVLDPNGNGVPGAVIWAGSIIPPGGKPVGYALDQRHGVITDQKGRFRMYPPIGEDIVQIGTLIPPKAKCSVRVEPPQDSSLEDFAGIIPSGQQSTIRLDYAGYFHTFVFEGEDGPITDPQLLQNIDIFIRRPGQPKDTYLPRDKWEKGCKVPLGIYRVELYKYEFEPLELTADSPEKLIFKLKAARTYHGNVVNGTSGEPMAAATVTISRRSSALTDETGRFEITTSPGEKIRKIVVSKENYLTVKVLKGWTKQDEDGKYEALDVKLFPAATVTVEPVAKKWLGRWTLKFRPQWFVVDRDNPYWVSDLLAVCGKHPDDGIYRDFELQANKRNSLQVPAGVNLRIHLRVLHNIEWAPVTIANNLKLEQGQVFDAGRHIIGDPFAIFVEVLDSAGKPVEGVPVIVCGDHDPTISSSDEYGFAFFDFVGPSEGEFIVEYDPGDDADAPHLRQAIPYEIAGIEDANSVYTLQVSDEILHHLFK